MWKEFTLKYAMVFGGYNLLTNYVTTKHVEMSLRQSIGIEKAAWSTYDLPFLLRHLIDGCLMGVEQAIHLEILENENLITQKRGVYKLPDYNPGERSVVVHEREAHCCMTFLSANHGLMHVIKQATFTLPRLRTPG